MLQEPASTVYKNPLRVLRREPGHGLVGPCWKRSGHILCEQQFFWKKMSNRVAGGKACPVIIAYCKKVILPNFLYFIAHARGVV